MNKHFHLLLTNITRRYKFEEVLLFVVIIQVNCVYRCIVQLQKTRRF